jgi:hypothetical protein
LAQSSYDRAAQPCAAAKPAIAFLLQSWTDRKVSSRHSIMIARILEKLTGKDDLERVAYQEDLALLNAYLKKRRVFIPQRPRRFLDAATFTQEQLMEQIRKDSEQLSSEQFEPWILEVDGKKRLPAFSSQEKMTAFASRMSQDMNKVFGLGCISILLEDVTKQVDIDFVDLNLFSKKSWEIGIGKRT